MKKLIYVVVALFVFVAGLFLNDNIRMHRNMYAAVKVGNVNDINGVGTSFKRINTLTALGENYEVYLVSQEVPVGHSYISTYDPSTFDLDFVINFNGVIKPNNTSSLEETDSKTLYILVCAPAGYTNAQQVIEYHMHHYSIYIDPTFSIDGTDESRTYLVSCQ